MSDRDPLRERFAAYRGELTTTIDGPGPEVARRTLRRRRRTAVAAGAALAVALVVAPIAAGAALRQDRPPPPAATPTPDVTPTPSGSPSASPTPTPSASRTPDAPDGRISRAELLSARLALPAWRPGSDCPSDGVRLTGDGTTGRDGTLLIEALDYGDIDGDGAVETLVMIRCVFGTAGPEQVVAFDRDGTERIVTVGRVVATVREGPQWLTALDVGSTGLVRVQVADLMAGGGWPGAWSRRQWRGYRWNGERFTQVAGPTSFGPNPYSTDLAVNAKDVVLADDPTDGSRVGVVEVTIRNLGDRQADSVSLTLDLPKALAPDGPAWQDCGPDIGRYRPPLVCNLGAIDAHGARTLRLGVRLPAGTSLAAGTATVHGMALGPGGHNLLDPVVGNNDDTISYR